MDCLALASFTHTSSFRCHPHVPTVEPSVAFRLLDDVAVFVRPQAAAHAQPAAKFFVAFRLTRCKPQRSIRGRVIFALVPK